MAKRYAGEKPGKDGNWYPTPTPKKAKAAVKKEQPKKAAPATKSGGKNYKNLPR